MAVIELRDRDFDAQNVPESVRIHAERMGTWGKHDRTAQYLDSARSRPEALLHSQNEQWNRLRQLQANNDRLQSEVNNLRLRNAIIVAAVTAITTVVGQQLLRFFLPVLR